MATRKRNGKKRRKAADTSGRTFEKTQFASKGNSRYNRHDPLFKKAREEGFVARSIYKLEELDVAFDIIREGDDVLDLGCAPGSWLQYCDRKVTQKGGRVVGIDLLPVQVSLGEHVHTLQGDIYETTLEELMHPRSSHPGFDVVLSDMAPNTMGVHSVDQARSIALAERALQIADEMLREGGRYCVKVLEGADFQGFIGECKKVFKSVKIKRPKGTRVGSTETYVVAFDKKPKA